MMSVMVASRRTERMVDGPREIRYGRYAERELFKYIREEEEEEEEERRKSAEQQARLLLQCELRSKTEQAEFHSNLVNFDFRIMGQLVVKLRLSNSDHKESDFRRIPVF